MIKWILKYGLLIYLLNTVLLSIEATFTLGDNVFIILMVIFSFSLLLNLKMLKEVILHKAFGFFLILNCINIFYWLIFHNFSDLESIKYLLARAMQFSIISFGVVLNYDYFKEDFLKHVVYVILVIILLGLIVDPFIFEGRYRGLLWNPNILSSLSCLAFSVLFLSLKRMTNYDSLILAFLVLVSLSTGSRGVLVAIPLAFLFRYGFSYRNILYSLGSVVIYSIVLNFQLQTSINRFASQSLLNDRLLQYKYAFQTIQQKPFFGFGLDKYAYINPELIPSYLQGHIISAHNAYLAVIVQYGIIFGLFFFGVVFYKTIQIYFNINRGQRVESFYFYIIIYVIIASFYESLITGINEIHTIFFWFSLAFLSYSIYKRKYEN